MGGLTNMLWGGFLKNIFVVLYWLFKKIYCFSSYVYKCFAWNSGCRRFGALLRLPQAPGTCGTQTHGGKALIDMKIKINKSFQGDTTVPR